MGQEAFAPKGQEASVIPLVATSLSFFDKVEAPFSAKLRARRRGKRLATHAEAFALLLLAKQQGGKEAEALPFFA